MRIKAATILSKGHLKAHKGIPSKIFGLKIQVWVEQFLLTKYSLNSGENRRTFFPQNDH